MIGNAAGPVMSVYLLSARLPKLVFVGTNAWFFLLVNYMKLPFQIFAWDNIGAKSLAVGAVGIPFILLGAVFGIWFVKKLPEKWYRAFIVAIHDYFDRRDVLLLSPFRAEAYRSLAPLCALRGGARI